MCETCGCNRPGEGLKIYKPGETPEIGHVHESETEHFHRHGHYSHSHSDHEDVHYHSHENGEHSHVNQQIVQIEQDVLMVNEMQAARNRGWFEAKNILALNLVSSPGSGKTSLLEKTIKEAGKEFKCFVIEGDQQTDNDARRIQATGSPVVQINTGNACHLDADMVYQAVQQLKPDQDSIVFIENVGNLVCPAMFDLGESSRVVIFSVTEGEDKPLKYPNMFNSSDVCVINKIDLLPYVDFDMAKARENALKVNHHLKFIEVSVKSGQGINEWLKWLKESTQSSR